MKGALNLNNNEGTAGEPLWKDFDGAKDLSFEDVVFQDGRKDGKEGETNGAQTNETPQGLNKNIIENYATIVAAVPATPAQPATYEAVTTPVNGETYYAANDGSDANGFVYDGSQAGPYYKKTADAVPAQAGTPAKFADTKTLGVGAMTLDANNEISVVKEATVDATSKAVTGTVLLFGGDPAQNGGYFYVIPRNEQTNGNVGITIAYDVETIDGALAGKLSDGETHGISIENVISKSDIFSGLDFKAGYTYDIQIHLGMTSVKIAATVTDWKDAVVYKVDLPDNQPANP
jgi:hypothetical protein